MNIIFETPRLYFREFTVDDVQLLFNLNNNPNVIKYVHELPPTTENTTNTLLNIILPQYKLYGYGRWAVYQQSDDHFVGWCGLKFLEENNEIDLGYRFKEEYWNKGYGYEAANATIDYGFNVLKLSAIYARALPGNIASLKIMEKCGMQYVGDVIDTDELMVKKYVIGNDQLTAKPTSTF